MLRKMLVQFSELICVALECQICAAVATAQPAQPPLRMSSAFPNVGGAVEETQGSCMIKRRLQRKFEWTELPAVLAERLLRLHGLFALSLPSQFSPLAMRAISPHTSSGSWYTMVRQSAPLGYSVFFLIPRMPGSTPPVDKAKSTCALGEGSTAVVNQKIIPHLPTRHVSTNGSEKHVIGSNSEIGERTNRKLLLLLL